MLLTNKSKYYNFKYPFILLGIIGISAFAYTCNNNTTCRSHSYYSKSRGSAAHHGRSCFHSKSILNNNISISNIKMNDKIFGWDKNNNIKLLEIENILIHHGHFQLYSFELENNYENIITNDFITDNHPIKLYNNSWCSINNKIIDDYYKILNIKQCKINDIIYYNNTDYKIININKGIITDKVYDIEVKGDYNSFLVNLMRVID